MYRKNRKISTIILSYSLILTAIIIMAGYYFINEIPKPTPIIPSVVYVANEDNLIRAFTTGVLTLDVDANKINTTSLANYYRNEVFKYIPFLIVGLLFVVSISTWILWKVLLWNSDRMALEVVGELQNFDSDNNTIHPIIEKGVQEFKKKITASNDDYIRLCGYITHEQKNVLALLRAKLQIEGREQLIKEVDLVANSIDDILTLTTIDEASDSLQIVDSALVCAKVVGEYQKIYKDIIFEFDDEINTQIKAKELWLYRSIANLLDNAIKYANQEVIRVVIENKNKTVIIKVIDSGPGIDIKQQEKLFENRYRINGIKKNGYGIGLSLVRHVCELCDGYVWVESKPNQGTTFYLTFLEVLTLD